jgi:hypothetical protein
MVLQEFIKGVAAALHAAIRPADIPSSSQADDNDNANGSCDAAVDIEKAPSSLTSATEVDDAVDVDDDAEAQSDQEVPSSRLPEPTSISPTSWRRDNNEEQDDDGDGDDPGEGIRWIDVAVLVLCLFGFLAWMAAHMGTQAVATGGHNLTFVVGIVVVGLVAVAIVSCLLAAAASASASSLPSPPSSTKGRICTRPWLFPQRFHGGCRGDGSDRKLSSSSSSSMSTADTVASASTGEPDLATSSTAETESVTSADSIV